MPAEELIWAHARNLDERRSASMRLLVGLGLWGCVMAAGIAHAQEAADPDSAQLVCDLTGDCAAGGPDSATAPEAATPRGKPRASQTRGFSFQRAQADTGQPTRQQVAVAPTPSPRAPAKPVQVGAADLKLTFVSGSAILTESAKARLARYATVLGGPKLAGRRIRIEGHTDASGSAKANLDLSRRRAQAVADFLIATGIDAKRLEVVGLGSTRPLPGITPQAAENRRVMAVLL
jgi:outer membrane protein OmpA-like peptidoglycan-associated protein